MFRNSRRLDDHETRLATLALAVAELRQALELHSDKALKGRIVELELEVETLRKSLRSLHGSVAHAKRGAARDEPAHIVDDEEFQAMLALQNAHGSRQ